MRMFLRCASLAVLVLFLATAAHADSIYTLTLTSSSGNAGNGTGSFDINVAPCTTTNCQSTYISTNTVGDILKSLSFTIGGDTFTLANAASNYGLVQFTSGSLSDITYSGSENTMTAIVSLSANGLTYSYYDSAKSLSGTGTITATLSPNVAATPEPSSIALLGTGLLGVAGVLRKRFA